MKYVKPESGEDAAELLAVSTEDGRIVFYSTQETSPAKGDNPSEGSIPDAVVKGQLGGKACELTGRIKEFEILNIGSSSKKLKHESLVVTCNSDGAVRVWSLSWKELTAENSTQKKAKGSKKNKESTPVATVPQVGKLLGTYETGNRITCMKAFVMLQPQEEMSDSEDESASGDNENSEEDSSDSDED